MCLIMTHNASAGSSGQSTILKTHVTPGGKPTMSYIRKDGSEIFWYRAIDILMVEAGFTATLSSLIGTFRSDYDYKYEYEFSNVYPVRMPDCVRLSRQLVLSSKSGRRLDANYEIFKKSRPPTTSSLQVQKRVKRFVFKGADTL